MNLSFAVKILMDEIIKSENPNPNLSEALHCVAEDLRDIGHTQRSIADWITEGLKRKDDPSDFNLGYLTAINDLYIRINKKCDTQRESWGIIIIKEQIAIC